MIGILNEYDLKKNPVMQSVPVMEGDDEVAQLFLDNSNACEFAEAVDAIRLYELLHRDEYRPVAVVRNSTDGLATIRVYFRQLHESEIPGNDDRESDRTNFLRRRYPRGCEFTHQTVE